MTASFSTDRLSLQTRVTEVNDLPIVEGDTSGRTKEDTQLLGQLLVSDNDGLENSEIYSIENQARIGIATVDATSGQWTFTPAANRYGSDSFTISIRDDNGPPLIKKLISKYQQLIIDHHR